MTTPAYIIFTNNGGKAHTNARCGMTRSNHCHNVPVIVETITDPCKRCASGTYAVADPSTIKRAWDAAQAQSKRNPYGRQYGWTDEYTLQRVAEMTTEWMNREGATR